MYISPGAWPRENMSRCHETALAMLCAHAPCCPCKAKRCKASFRSCQHVKESGVDCIKSFCLQRSADIQAEMQRHSGCPQMRRHGPGRVDGQSSEHAWASQCMPDLHSGDQRGIGSWHLVHGQQNSLSQRSSHSTASGDVTATDSLCSTLHAELWRPCNSVLVSL